MPTGKVSKIRSFLFCIFVGCYFYLWFYLNTNRCKSLLTQLITSCKIYHFNMSIFYINISGCINYFLFWHLVKSFVVDIMFLRNILILLADILLFFRYWKCGSIWKEMKIKVEVSFIKQVLTTMNSISSYSILEIFTWLKNVG